VFFNMFWASVAFHPMERVEANYFYTHKAFHPRNPFWVLLEFINFFCGQEECVLLFVIKIRSPKLVVLFISSHCPNFTAIKGRRKKLMFCIILILMFLEENFVSEDCLKSLSRLFLKVFRFKFCSIASWCFHTDFSFRVLKHRHSCTPHFSQRLLHCYEMSIFRLHVSTVLSHHQVYKIITHKSLDVCITKFFAKFFKILKQFSLSPFYRRCFDVIYHWHGIKTSSFKRR
jgi:hypothetical protein